MKPKCKFQEKYGYCWGGHKVKPITKRDIEKVLESFFSHAENWPSGWVDGQGFHTRNFDGQERGDRRSLSKYLFNSLVAPRKGKKNGKV